MKKIQITQYCVVALYCMAISLPHPEKVVDLVIAVLAKIHTSVCWPQSFQLQV